jgi:hypothetical protein
MFQGAEAEAPKASSATEQGVKRSPGNRSVSPSMGHADNSVARSGSPRSVSPTLKNEADDLRSPKRRRLSQDALEQNDKPLPQPTVPTQQAAPAQPCTSTLAPIAQNSIPTALTTTSAPAVPPVEPSAVSASSVVPPPPLNPLEHLSALDRQASELLTFLSRLTPAEAYGLASNPSAEKSKQYATLRSSFDRTRRLVSPGWPFLPHHDLGLRNNQQVEIARKANVAIFMSSIFTGEIGLRDMDRSFLAVFIPEDGALSKAQSAMYIELKTQGFITAWRTNAAPPPVVMADMFGPDLDKALLARRPGTTELTMVELQFLHELITRRSILEYHVKHKNLDQLPIRYTWEEFSQLVFAYLNKHVQHDIGGTQRQSEGEEDCVGLAARAAEAAVRATLGLGHDEVVPSYPSFDDVQPVPPPEPVQPPKPPEQPPSQVKIEETPAKATEVKAEPAKSNTIPSPTVTDPKKPFVPSKAEVEAVIARAAAASRSDTPQKVPA